MPSVEEWTRASIAACSAFRGKSCSDVHGQQLTAMSVAPAAAADSEMLRQSARCAGLRFSPLTSYPSLVHHSPALPRSRPVGGAPEQSRRPRHHAAPNVLHHASALHAPHSTLPRSTSSPRTGIWETVEDSDHNERVVATGVGCYQWGVPVPCGGVGAGASTIVQQPYMMAPGNGAYVYCQRAPAAGGMRHYAGGASECSKAYECCDSNSDPYRAVYCYK